MSQLTLLGLGAVLDGIPARVALLDRERRHRYVNLEYATFIGQPASAILGKTVAEIIGAAAYEAIKPHGDRALVGETVHWEGWLPYTRDAASRYVQRIYMPFRGGDDVIDGYLVFVRDLTELKLGERRLSDQLASLQESQALNAAITASALDCIIVIDEAGCVIEFNPAAERIFGHRRVDVLGRAIGDIIVPQHLRQRHATGFTRYLTTGEAHVLGRRIEIEGLRADGTVFPLELAITEVRLPGRRLFTAYLRDLTAARSAATELQQSRDALHQSEKMAAFGSLLAGVAHELNNPLSIVVGNAMMLKEDAENIAPSLASRAAKIHTAADRCARIVRTFLAMARQRTAVSVSFALRPSVLESLDLLAYGLRTGGITVETDIPDDLPEVTGDPDQFSQVIVNLLVNAQQALAAVPPPRRVVVSARADQQRVWLTVSDTGPGVPDAVKGQIFDPFFTTKAMGAGTGIGLAVSRGIIEAHGGTLTLLETGRGGAAFEIMLEVGAPASIVGTTDLQEAQAPVSGRTALIVDDEPEVASLVADMLTVLGFACETVHGGAEAQAEIARRDYDAIICDLHMPGIDGAALFAWLAASRPGLCDRVVFLTADALGETAGRFLAECGRPVLEKPFAPSEVRRALLGLTPNWTRHQGSDLGLSIGNTPDVPADRRASKAARVLGVQS